jgi:streptogramin lyase
MLRRREFLGTAIAGGISFAQASRPPARKPKAVVKLFKSPEGHPNGLETTTEGLWIGEQVSDRAYLVDWNGKVLRKLDTESHNTSGIAAGGGFVWMAANGAAVIRDAKPSDKPIGEVLQCDSKTGRTLRRYVFQWGGGVHGIAWNHKTNTLWITALGIAALSEVDPKDDFRILHQIPVRLGRAHGLDFEDDAVWCMFSTDLQIHKLDMKTGRILDIIQLSKDDPDPHGMCIHEGKLYYCDAGIAPGAKDSGSPNQGYICRIDM